MPYLSQSKGEHTRQVRQHYNPRSNIMARFITASRRCLGCNCALSGSDNDSRIRRAGAGIHVAALCPRCLPLRLGLLQTKRAALERVEEAQSKLASRCLDCAGSIRLANLCRNIDCEVLFSRYRTSEALQAAKAEILALSISEDEDRQAGQREEHEEDGVDVDGHAYGPGDTMDIEEPFG